MTAYTSIHGLHMMMIHDPERAIRHVNAIRKPGGRIHKIIVHGNKCDWLDRMPPEDKFVVRNVDISEQRITSREVAIANGKEHALAHYLYMQDAKSKGISPDRLYFEGLNEPVPAEMEFLNDYETTRIAEAARLGVPHLVLFQFSVGQPTSYGYRPETAVDWERFEPTRKAARVGDFYGCHQYFGLDGANAVWSGNSDMKWVAQGHRLLQCPWPEKKWIMTEAGCDDGVNGNQKESWASLPIFYPQTWTYDKAQAWYIEQLKWSEEQYLLDGRVVGMVLFTHDYENNEWEKFNVDDQVFWPPYEQFCNRQIELNHWGDPALSKWRPIIEHRAPQFGIEPLVIATMVYMGSKGVVNAVGNAGMTIGLMQVACKESGRADRPERVVLLHPERNIVNGCSILSQILKAANGNLALALTNYFGAAAAVDTFISTWGKLWPGLACPVTGKPVVVTPPAATIAGALQNEFGAKFTNLVGLLPHNGEYAKRPLASVNKIVIHHTASAKTTTPEQIAQWHLGREWPGIAYHILVKPDGQVLLCNDMDRHTYHAGDANATSVGICAPGNYMTDTPDDAMLAAMARVVKVVRAFFAHPMTVMGHRDVMQTACPGTKLYAELSRIDTGAVTTPVDPPVNSALKDKLLALAAMHQVLKLNKDAALQKAIYAAGFVPTSEEFAATIDSVAYIGQRAEHLASGEVRVYYCRVGDYSNVKYEVRG